MNKGLEIAKQRWPRGNALVVLLFSMLMPAPTFAINHDGSGRFPDDGLVVLYNFNEGSGNIVRDTSGVTPAMDLVIDDPSFVTWLPGALDVRRQTLIRSNGPATKIINSCKSSNALTVEAWIENNSDDQPEQAVPLRIVTLSKRTNNSAFFIGQGYDNGSHFHTSVRTGNGNNNAGVLRSEDSQTQDVFKRDRLTRVVFTRDTDGVGRLYVTDKDGALNIVARDVGGNFNGNFNGWPSDLSFGLANEISYKEPVSQNNPKLRPNSPYTQEMRGWLGKLYLVAVYCKAHTPEQILGSRAPTARFDVIKPTLDPPTPNRQKALVLYKRIVGVGTPLDNPVLVQMENLINQNDWLGAARIATNENNFINITVRDFAKRMSTRDETVNTPLNDFVSTIMGVARDGIDARQLLVGDFFYMGNPQKSAVSQNLVNDLIRSNRHYMELEEQGYDLASVLMKVDGQKISNASGQAVRNIDPAGVLTSRAFMEAHAVAGTNRRLVEFTFREFLCVPINAWADASGPDNDVGRDVDRFPAGSHEKFLKTCRACHSNMDGLRGAFSRVTFSNGFVKHSLIFPPSNDPNDDDPTRMYQNPVGIAGKMNRNGDTYPGGKVTSDDSWVNNANRGLNATYFGWRGEMRGSGIRPFANMVANAKAFPRCMAKRAFRALCKRDAQLADDALINKAADEFEQASYNMKELFARVAVAPECIGDTQ